MAAIPNTLHSPVTQVSANQLRIASNQIEGQINLRRVELSDKIKQTLPNAYALVIRQDYQSANAEKVCPHTHVCNCDKGYRLFLVEGNVASDAYTKLPIQIMILPKHLPHGSAAPINLELNGRPNPFFRSNTIVPVQKTQSGSNQSTTS